jgi:hypothetical protein
MATNPGQGNNTQGNYASFPQAGVTTNVYVYTTVANPIVGTVLFWTGDGSVTAPIGSYKLTYADGTKKIATVNNLGVITALTLCTFNSTKYNNDPYTSTKNNCTAGSCTVVGSTVNLNDGNQANFYQTSGTASSNISQADADSQAQAIADAAFNAGKQNKVNELGYCTWTYNNGSSAANAYFRPFTRNNCAANCDAGTWTTYSVAKTGYSYSSTDAVAGCQGAIDGANLAAYNAAKAEVDNNGQTNANNNASCCCWVAASTAEKCSGCDYKAYLEKNQCTGAFRNTTVTGTSCSCGENCSGTYLDYYCSGPGGVDRYRIPRYNCTGGTAGAESLYQECDGINCGASTSPNYEYKGYSICYNCAQANVYQQINKCANNYTAYFVYSGGYQYVGGQPTASTCNTSSNCVDVGGGYCSGPNYVINRSQNNPCSGDPCPPRVIEYNSQTYGCYNPCDGFRDPNYVAQGYATCISCQNFDVYRDTNSCSYTYQHYFVNNYGWQDQGSSAPGGGCNYTSNCADTGSAYCSGPNWVINTYQTNGCLSGGCGTRVIEYNSTTHGCYSPPACTSWRLENYNYYGITDYIEWTDCNNNLNSTYLSDMSFLDICFKNGTSVTYSYSTPFNNGSC